MASTLRTLFRGAFVTHRFLHRPAKFTLPKFRPLVTTLMFRSDEWDSVLPRRSNEKLSRRTQPSVAGGDVTLTSRTIDVDRRSYVIDYKKDIRGMGLLKINEMSGFRPIFITISRKDLDRFLKGFRDLEEIANKETVDVVSRQTELSSRVINLGADATIEIILNENQHGKFYRIKQRTSAQFRGFSIMLGQEGGQNFLKCIEDILEEVEERGGEGSDNTESKVDPHQSVKEDLG